MKYRLAYECDSAIGGPDVRRFVTFTATTDIEAVGKAWEFMSKDKAWQTPC